MENYDLSFPVKTWLMTQNKICKLWKYFLIIFISRYTFQFPHVLSASFIIICFPWRQQRQYDSDLFTGIKFSFSLVTNENVYRFSVLDKNNIAISKANLSTWTLGRFWELLNPILSISVMETAQCTQVQCSVMMLGIMM